MPFNFEGALSSLDAVLAQTLKPMLTQEGFDATLSQEQASQLQQASGLSDSALAVALLPLAATLSIADVSNFHVGAIVRGKSGRLYFGANMEFTQQALFHSVHAEQSAITHAWLKGEEGIIDITINYSPCGHCRQFMNELIDAQSLNIILPDMAQQALSFYLPNSFGPSDLAINRRLMDQQLMGFSVPSKDSLVLQALAAMNASYAPYSQHYSGIALKLNNGEVYTGRYAENAAFNPSLCPLQVALVQIVMAGGDIQTISRVVLLEREQSSLQLYAATQELLNSLHCDVAIEHFRV